MTAEEINAEATGFFMVPPSYIGADFTLATSTEASAIVGRTSDCPPEDYINHSCSKSDSGSGNGGSSQLFGSGAPSAGGGGGCQFTCSAPGGGGGGGGGCCEDDLLGGWPSDPANPIEDLIAGPGEIGLSTVGMPTWKVSQPYLNLWVDDIPISYQPSKGPAVTLKLSYQQRNDIVFSGQFANLWHSTFHSMVDKTYPDIPRFFPLGGGAYWIELPDGTNSNLLFDKPFRMQALIDSGTVTGYVAKYKNGAQLRYFQPNGIFFHLSEMIDPAGNKLTYAYNTSPFQLASITDADGGVTSLSYSTVGTNTFITITTPDSRSATLRRDDWGRLQEVTDSVGITSSFGYDNNGWINSITTPYGTHTFNFDYVGVIADRSVVAALPTGGREAWMHVDVATTAQIATNGHDLTKVPTNTPFISLPNYPYGTMDITNRQDRNTFYWNPQQFAACSTTNLADLVWADIKKSHIRHWLWKWNDGYAHMDTLGSEQLPSPDGTTEGQIFWYDYEGKYYWDPEFRGTYSEPSVIATVMPDGSTWYKYIQRSTNWGRPTAIIEKWVENGVDQFRTNTFAYSADGVDLLEHRFQADGIDHLIAGYGYDAFHHVTSVTNALGEVSTSTYDGSQRLVTHQSASGLISSNSYGLDGRVSEVVVYESGGNPVSTNQYTWSGGNLLTHTDPRGLTTTHTWDALARVTKIDFPDGSHIKHAYTNGSGAMLLHRTYTRDRMGNETRWTYTPDRQVENIIDPRGITNHFEYCDCGSLQSATTAYLTPLAEITDYFYDNRMRLVETDFPNGSWKTNAYDSLGRLIVQGDPLGSSTNTYDNLSRLLTSSNAFGQSFKAVYDVENQVTSRTDANGVTVASTYDDLHRVRTRTFPDSGIESFGYTPNVSGPTSYTNQLGKVTTYAYDKLGRKTNEIIVGLATNSFAFAPAGDLFTLTDGKSQVTTWAYDLYGRVATKKYADGNTNLVYAYDANSRLTNRWSAAKGNTAYEYDANGNLTKIDYPTSPDVTFAYDAHNRSTNEIVTGTFTNNFTYHPGGALATEDGPWPNDTLTYTYNTAGLRDGLTIQQPTGSFTNGYTYDAAHRLTAITATSGAFTYDYYPDNNSITAPTHLIRKLTLPPGAYITNSYDNSARELRTRLMTSAHAELNDHEYLYNVGNQRTQQTRTDDSYVTYTYDDAGQLRTAYTTNVSNVEITAQRYMYGYDAAWNMIARTNNATPQNYVVNNLNQTTSRYNYDSNGNPSTDGSRFYEFDDENRLISIYADTILNPSGSRTDYFYDARGRLRKRVTYSWNDSLSFWSLNTEQRYVYDGMLEVQERNHANTPLVTYTRGLDLSDTLQGAGGIGGMLARSSSYQSGTGAWNTHLFYHADANGNITYLAQSNQTLGASYRYDPFGRTITSSGSFAAANLYRFSSKPIDLSWDLYYYTYRFYDIFNQRWVNRDPIGEDGGINLYRFNNNSPRSHLINTGLYF